MTRNDTLTALLGVRVGHWTDPVGMTGCTVVLLPPGGAVASCDVRGPAPGTRETVLLEPARSVERAHAFVLSGGSAYGLAAAGGVVEFLENAGEGLATRFGRVPIVPAAVIFDLGVGSPKARPGPAQGLEAARLATAAPVIGGRVGAGTGATAGKYLGEEAAEPGGLGSAVVAVGGALVAALAVANPRGDIVDERGEVVAGARLPDGSRPSELALLEALARPETSPYAEATNTTLAVVGTNAPLSKVGCRVLAEAAQTGIARATRPAHTPYDGDTAFAFSTGEGPAVPLVALAAAAGLAVARAVVAAVRGAPPQPEPEAVTGR